MSVADKLTEIAENVPKVYETGFSDGESDGYSEGFYFGYDEGYMIGHADGYTEGNDYGRETGYNEGQQAEYDRFWDSFQQSGTRRNYPYAFGGSCWKDDTFNPKYDIIINNLCTNMFAYSSQITSTKVPIIIDSSGYSTGVFLSCTRLKTIPSLKVCETNQTFSTWFQDCTALENITFTKDSVVAASISFQWSTKLTKASIESIFGALSASASGKSLSLPKTAVNNAFTDAEWATLVATKSNWTINLI